MSLLISIVDVYQISSNKSWFIGKSLRVDISLGVLWSVDQTNSQATIYYMNY